MFRRFAAAARTLAALVIAGAVLCFPVATLTAPSPDADSLSAEQARLLNGEIILVLSGLGDGVTGISAKIHIATPPQKVWKVLTE
jgi:hypothetical protein